MNLKALLTLACLSSTIRAASVVITIYPQSTSTNNGAVTQTRAGSTSSTSSSSSSDSSITSATGQTTAITDCHYHETAQYCVDGNGLEGLVVGAATNSASGAASYTSCHTHSATETYCVDSEGEEVQFVVEDTTSASTTTSSSGTSCHYHAGVEHCTGGDEEETTSCEKTDRDYNIPLRIGLLFVVLVTSFIAAFAPIFLNKVFNISTQGIIFIILKQFGTGVIISTGFVHLITHAGLYWASDCIGELAYESTGTAITMAGLFIAFLVEYFGKRLVGWRHHAIANSKVTTSTGGEASNSDSDKVNEPTISPEIEKQIGHDHHGHGLLIPDDKISVLVMEAGIVFHSILIGITLVVAADSYFITLLIVIIFHQMFEGLALGSRITEMKDTKYLTKFLMTLVFSVITPIGMAIGIGVLSKFNGNDKTTIIALGTLDSFSAGVLIWTGVVEMWVNDWLFGTLANANKLKTSIGMFSLIAGMLLMSVLGKWA